MRVSNNRFFSKLLLVVANLCNSYDFLANKFVCTVLTDLLTRFCRKVTYMYITHDACLKLSIFSKLLFVVVNLCNFQFFGK